MYGGKRIQQNLREWLHYNNHPKWAYYKAMNSAWFYFYQAFHNLPSEKIVSWEWHGINGAQAQLWALGQNE